MDRSIHPDSPVNKQEYTQGLKDATGSEKTDRGGLSLTVETLFSEGDVVELRMFKKTATRPVIDSGFFTDFEKLIEAAEGYDADGYEIYVTLNKLKPGVLGDHEPNVVSRAKSGGGASDDDVERRVWLFIDVDPEREGIVSSTDEEKAIAWEKIQQIRKLLAALGWGDGVLCNSGNGYHLLYRIDLPNDEASLALVGGVLEGLKAKFEDETAKIDLKNKNAARIDKFYGVVAKKGENTPERPHRRSGILEVGEDLTPISEELLAEVAALKPSWRPPPDASRPAGDGDSEESIKWVWDFTAKHEIPIGKHGPWKDGGYTWEPDMPCPWNAHYGDTAFWVGVKPTGEIVGGCHHNSCSEYDWHDIREHYEPGHKEQRAKFAEEEAESQAKAGAGEDGGKAKEGNQAQRLIGYAMEDAAELFVDQNGTEHALIAGASAPLDRGCYGWLRRLFWEHEEAAASTELLGTVAGQLRAFAEVSGIEHHLHLRAAQHGGGMYLYLGPGRVVRVDAHGWKLDPDPPVMFRRVANLKELPDPKRGGSLDLLDAFMTAQEDRDHRLAKAWLVLALLADIPRPILLAHGPQGSTKSGVQRVLKNTIDPARPTTLKLREKNFEQNINKAFIPFFDNVSTISDHMADELSKAVTGAGNAVRKLYEDDEDVIREYKRAMLLNGLIIPTEKADLIDRILPVALKRVPKEKRETERRMQVLFDERHPKLLGAVLDALSGALAYHEEVRGLPRLADWGEFAVALYKHLDWGGYKGFMDDWAVIEEGQHETTLESSALAQCVVALMKEHEVVQKPPAKMLKLLQSAAFSEGIDPDSKDNDFPASASWLWKRLVPVIPTLEAFRISVTDGHEGSGSNKKRFIRIARFVGPDEGSEAGGGDSKTESGDAKTESGEAKTKGGTASGTARDSKENLLTAEKADTYAAGTAGTAGTAFFPTNRKDTEERIDEGSTPEASLQSGISAVPAVPAVPEAYLSQKNAVSKQGDAVPNGESAVPPPSRPRVVSARRHKGEYVAEFEAYVGHRETRGGHDLAESYFANPYMSGPLEERLAKYKVHLQQLLSTEEGQRELEKLRDKVSAGGAIACFCPGKNGVPDVLTTDDPIVCHGQLILLELERGGEPVDPPAEFNVDGVAVEYEILSAEEADPALNKTGAWLRETFLVSPPGWFRKQSEKYLENPNEITLDHLCRAVAVHVSGNDELGGEMEPTISAWLRHRGADGLTDRQREVLSSRKSPGMWYDRLPPISQYQYWLCIDKEGFSKKEARDWVTEMERERR